MKPSLNDGLIDFMKKRYLALAIFSGLALVCPVIAEELGCSAPLASDAQIQAKAKLDQLDPLPQGTDSSIFPAAAHDLQVINDELSWFWESMGPRALNQILTVAKANPEVALEIHQYAENLLGPMTARSPQLRRRMDALIGQAVTLDDDIRQQAIADVKRAHEYFLIGFGLAAGYVGPWNKVQWRPQEGESFRRRISGMARDLRLAAVEEHRKTQTNLLEESQFSSEIIGRRVFRKHYALSGNTGEETIVVCRVTQTLPSGQRKVFLVNLDLKVKAEAFPWTLEIHDIKEAQPGSDSIGHALSDVRAMAPLLKAVPERSDSPNFQSMMDELLIVAIPSEMDPDAEGAAEAKPFELRILDAATAISRGLANPDYEIGNLQVRLFLKGKQLGLEESFKFKGPAKNGWLEFEQPVKRTGFLQATQLSLRIQPGFGLAELKVHQQAKLWGLPVSTPVELTIRFRAPER